MIAKCKQCNIEFTPKRDTKGLFCSYNCYWESKKGNSDCAKNFGKFEVWNKGIKIDRDTHPTFGNWKGGITPQDKIDRKRFSETISKEVFERDDYTCQICLQRGKRLHADHIKSWYEYPELRFDIDNCRTLCVPCHYYITFKKKMSPNNKWGYKYKESA